MKKIIYLIMTVLLCCLMVFSINGASEKPVITLHPQSPNYPHYSVAIYTVKADGSNLSATWYMEWQGKIYEISQIGGEMQDWEPYAGEAYGARKIDDHTFSFIFEGIERDLDGAYIWCVIEDGHYDVSSQKSRISVGNSSTPPEIISIPSELTVEQGDPAEIRCVAQASDDSQLSFLWYETDTGKLEDIRAVNRGEETSELLVCDTDTIGTRYYVCKVESENGGITYSSVVTVTVTEKEGAGSIPEDSQQITESQMQEDQTAPEGSMPSDTTANTPSGADPNQDSLPLWAILPIAIVAAGVGFSAVVLISKKKQ